VARALLVIAALTLGGCSRPSALDGTCDGDGGCAAGFRCVVGTGVCERFTTPLDVDGGAPPDANGDASDASASDGGSSDGSAGDAGDGSASLDGSGDAGG
jgi:hypothetical protein